MRARLVFVCAAGTLLLMIGATAAAKPPMARVDISGPRLSGGDQRISGRGAASGMWDSGIDLFGQLDDEMADSVEGLGLTPADLGPRYLVRYWFDVGSDKPLAVVRQELYPYAKDGPVTYTPPDQRLAGARGLTVTPGWYRSSADFLRYLVAHGLPDANPRPVVDRGPVTDAAGDAPTHWGWIALAVAGLMALFVATARLLHRAVATARPHR